MNLRCFICYDDLFTSSDEAEDSLCSTSCGHIFHCLCLMEWILESSNSNSCPFCRTNVTHENIFKLNQYIEESPVPIYKNTRSKTKPVDHQRDLLISKSEIALKSSLFDLKVKELAMKNLELQRLLKKHKAVNVECERLRYENDILNEENAKLKIKLKSEQEKTEIIRSDLRILDVIELDADAETEEHE